MIGILDYGLGNIRAFSNVYDRAGLTSRLVRTPPELDDLTHLILPGVGAFDEASIRLERSGLLDGLRELLAKRSVPLLGICVGMQLLADSSEEGSRPGLGLVPGRVRKLDPTRLRHRTALPHLGWNSVSPTLPSPLFEGLERDASFYFLHSYYFSCARDEHVLAEAEYGQRFACAVRQGQVFGVQFHPEKSHDCGVRLLRNFARIQA